MRAALRLRSHYVDLSSHLTRNPFKAEQFAFTKQFEGKNRTALINAGAAPGLTNLLAKRAAEMLDEVESVHAMWPGAKIVIPGFDGGTTMPPPPPRPRSTSHRIPAT